VRQLVQEIVAAVQPKMVITTGTGGAIGTQVALGDVVIASYTQFDCTQQFSGEIWAKSKFSTSPLPPGTLAKITPELTTLNAGRIPNARSQPQMWSGADATVVTTDYFAFDDSTNHDGLQGLGLACDMGDAMVGLALAAAPGVAWYSVRNASDPQIPNPDGDFEAASTKSTSIYSLYGGLTTAASVIACWAIVSSAFPPAAPAAAQTVSEIPVLASQQNVASRL
jgi:nucleoside phosphorylase